MQIFRILIILFALIFSISSQNLCAQTTKKPNSENKSEQNLPTLDSKTFHNGNTFILISQDDTPIFDEKSQIFWMPHPKKKKLKIALIPISYHQKSDKILYISEPLKTPLARILVEPKDYKKERISVQPSKIQYDQKTAQRIEKERGEAVQAYKTLTPKRLWSKPFIRPIDSVITSQYGNARVFNNKLQSFHTGTDFRAAIGTEVKASNDGVVLLEGDRFLSGKSVYIDHGYGVVSVYFHLDKIKVKVGEKVKRGQIIGLSGNTGRSSGPHLHFGIVVQGVNVDAMDFLEKIEELF